MCYNAGTCAITRFSNILFSLIDKNLQKINVFFSLFLIAGVKRIVTYILFSVPNKNLTRNTKI